MLQKDSPAVIVFLSTAFIVLFTLLKEACVASRGPEVGANDVVGSVKLKISNPHFLGVAELAVHPCRPLFLWISSFSGGH